MIAVEVMFTQELIGARDAMPELGNFGTTTTPDQAGQLGHPENMPRDRRDADGLLNDLVTLPTVLFRSLHSS